MHPHTTATDASAPSPGAWVVAMLILVVLVLACCANLESGSVFGSHLLETGTWSETSWLSKLGRYWSDHQLCADDIRDLGNTTFSAGVACIAFSLGSTGSQHSSASAPHYRLRTESAYTFKSVSTAVEPRPPRAEI